MTDTHRKNYYSLSFSGGKDSTALLLEWLRRGNHLDEVVHCDTGVEYPFIYNHVTRIEQLVIEKGIKFTKLKSEKSFEYYCLQHDYHSKKYNKEFKGYGWSYFGNRWCTTLLKTSILKKHRNELKKHNSVLEIIGIAADESKRAKPHENKIYPLVDWGMTEAECLKICYQNGFNYEGMYEKYKRTGCWCCPLQSLSDLKVLWKYYPELWDKLKLWDSVARNQFRRDYSVAELEAKFTKENAQKIRG